MARGISSRGGAEAGGPKLAEPAFQKHILAHIWIYKSFQNSCTSEKKRLSHVEAGRERRASPSIARVLEAMAIRVSRPATKSECWRIPECRERYSSINREKMTDWP